MSHTFLVEKEYFRLVAYLYITEDGVFKELPDDIATGYIKIEAVYVIVFGTAAGDMRAEFIYGNKSAMDKDKKVGGPVAFGSWTMYTEEGEGDSPITLSRSYNTYLTDPERATMDASWANMKAQKSVEF